MEKIMKKKLMKKVMKKKLMKKEVIVLFILFFAVFSFSKGEVSLGEGMKDSDLTAKFYKTFIEHFYKEDEPLNEVDPKTNKSYYIVKYNTKNQIDSVSYYTVEGGEELNRRVKQTQNVNFDSLAYYSIKYKYDIDSRLSRKEFRDENNKVISYYRYIWDNKISKIKFLEKWDKTPFLGKMELSSYNMYKWEGDNIKIFTYHDKGRVVVERFHFIRNPDTGENKDPMYLVGNNKISLFALSKYERFDLSSRSKERIFYVEYENRGNKIFPRRYNHDRVLIEEFPPIVVDRDNL